MFSEILPRMEAGEVFEANDGWSYRIKAGRLENNYPCYADDEKYWEDAEADYKDLGELNFSKPLPISDVARKLASEESERPHGSGGSIPCSACLTVRHHCNKRDMDCPWLNTPYGMQLLLNWLAGYGVKEVSE